MSANLHLLYVLLTWLLPACFTSANILPNGAFETEDANNKSRPSNWTFTKGRDVGEGEPHDDVKFNWQPGARDEKACVSISTANDSVFGSLSSLLVPVDPKHDYLLRFNYRCDDPGGGPATVAIVDKDGSRFQDRYLTESTEWTPCEFPFSSQYLKGLTVEFMVYHRPHQTFYFREVELVDVAMVPVIKTPPNNSILAATPAAIEWQAPAAHESFEVAYSNDPKFSPPTSTFLKNVTGNSAPLPSALADGTWFVRVTGKGRNGHQYGSKPACFVIDSQGAGKGMRADTTPPILWGGSPLADSRLTASPESISCRYEDEPGGSGMEVGTFCMRLDGQDVAQHGRMDNGTLRYVPQGPLPSGRHQAAVSVSDRAGNISGEYAWSFWIQSQEQSQVSINRDLNVCINGLPFFPIAVYGHSYSAPSSIPPRLAKAGFNTFWGGDMRENHRHNLKSIQAVNYQAPLASIEAQLKQQSGEETFGDMLLCHVFDEPDVTGVAPEQLQQISACIKRFLPFHPVACITAIPAKYGVYAGTAEIMVEDHYPVPSPPQFGVVQYSNIAVAIDRLKQAVKHRKPVFACLQAFDRRIDSGTVAAVPLADHRPTFEELWLMSCLSLVHGAKGVILYAARDTVALDLMLPVAHRLRYLTPLFCQPEANPSVTLEKGREILHISARHGPQNVLHVVSCNPTDAPVLARYALSSPIADVRVLFENRTIVPSQNTYADIHAPHSVHVYAVRFR